MSEGFSLHIGVNRVDPAHYGSEAPLRGCENDARDMQSIAQSLGYNTDVLLTRQATSANLFERLASAAAALAPGDTFLLTIAAHGSQIDDILGEEPEGRDETWCLYDRMVIDDEVYRELSRFREGVRVVVVPDSCHSRSSARQMIEIQKRARGTMKLLGIPEGTTFRCIEPFIDHDVFDQFGPVYAGVKRSLAPYSRAQGPDVVTLAACQDHQLAGDGARNGLFTEHLKRVWRDGAFEGDYESFRSAISNSINSSAQLPGIDSYGPQVASLLASKPFALGRDISDPSGATEDGQHVTRCRLEFPAMSIVGRSRRDVQRYVGEELAPLLVDTCLEAAAGSVAPRATRSNGRGSWEVKCEGSTSGGGKCEVSIGGSF